MVKKPRVESGLDYSGNEKSKDNEVKTDNKKGLLSKSPLTIRVLNAVTSTYLSPAPYSLLMFDSPSIILKKHI